MFQFYEQIAIKIILRSITYIDLIAKPSESKVQIEIIIILAEFPLTSLHFPH